MCVPCVCAPCLRPASLRRFTRWAYACSTAQSFATCFLRHFSLGLRVFDSSDSFATCFIPPVLRSSSQLYPRATLLFYLASAPSDLIRAALFLGDDVLTISCRRTSYSRIPIYIIRTTRGGLHNLRYTKNNFYQSRSKFLEILEGVHTRFTTIPRLSNPSLWLSAFCLYLPADKTALYTAVDTFVSRWSMGDVFVARNRLGCGVS